MCLIRTFATPSLRVINKKNNMEDGDNCVSDLCVKCGLWHNIIWSEKSYQGRFIVLLNHFLSFLFASKSSNMCMLISVSICTCTQHAHAPDRVGHTLSPALDSSSFSFLISREQCFNSKQIFPNR